MPLGKHSSEVDQDVEMTVPDDNGNRSSNSIVPEDSPQQLVGDQGGGRHVKGLVFKDVIFYLSNFLGNESVKEELETTLCEYGAIKSQSLSSENDTTQQTTSLTPTHIISRDLDFPHYNHAKARGIHIVKVDPKSRQLCISCDKYGWLNNTHFLTQLNQPEWVTASVKIGKLLNPDFYSADPGMIFSGIVLTTTGLPPFDRQMIREAVEDYGGEFTAAISSNLTHMITLTESGEKYDYVMKHPELGIKVVLPHWFQLSCNLKRLLPETIYRFPDPPLLNPDSINDRPDQVRGHAPLLYSNSVKTVTAFLSSSNKAQKQFLDGYSIIFGNDLNIVPERMAMIEDKIFRAGGKVVNEYSSENVDIVICRFRIGDLYIKASRDSKIVGSADWLLHILQTEVLSSPKALLLHYPIPSDCIPGMSSLVITVSNYTGNIREYLKRMILAMGGTYKPTLSNRTATEPTTHIICGNASGEKFEKGNEWNVKMVNHLWLEDSFQVWSLQSETKQKYTLFPAHYQLSHVFGVNIPPHVLDDWIGYEDDVMSPTPETARTIEPTMPAFLMEQGELDTNDQTIFEIPEDQSKSTPGVIDLDAGSVTPSPTKALSKKNQSRGKSSKSDTSASSISTSLSPTIYNSTTINDATKEPSSSSSSATNAENHKLGSVRVVSKKRGAAMQASKVLQKIVPDMNEFQDELRDEKKASKKKKKQLAAEELIEMDAEGSDTLHQSPKKSTSSPTKRRRISMGSVGVRDTPVISDDDDDADNTLDSPKAPSKKSRQNPKGDIVTQSTSIAPEQSSTAGKTKRVRYISTGVKDQSAAQIKALKALGVMPTTTVEKCTHLVATSISRTGKFLTALLHGRIIVHEDWLQACIDANMIVDEDNFRIEDSATEKKFGMDLYDSLNRARERKVFESCVFYLSPSIKQDMPQLKDVVEAGGGKVLTLLHTGLGALKDRVVKSSNSTLTTSPRKSSHQKKTRDSFNVADNDEDNDSPSLREKDEIVAVVSIEKDKDMWKPIVDAGAHIYSHDLISLTVLTQKLDLGPTHAIA
ncbi:hypothetical protein BGZ76_001921 [Entomortierella beljakovae]|nr:hypothetical protein BGZ76_001921 [Entomortierella beljakovae]